MKRPHRVVFLSLLLLVACRASDPQATETSPASPTPAEPIEVQAPGQVQSTVSAAPRVSATPELARRMRALADRERTLDALQLGARELVERCADADWSDPTIVADSVVAALVLESLIEGSGAWRETTAVLQRALPIPAHVPHEVRAQLELVLARSSVRTDRIVSAREWLDQHGTIRDWRVIGPFANERGGGFDVAYAPEEVIDLAASARGKERDVAWRAQPCPQSPLGVVVLDEMLRPNEQAIAYLATAIRVERARDVCLWLGTSGELKVWHGKRLALARKVQRSYHRDQDRVVLALQPGWNPILVKLGHEERGGWVASARLTALDGAPLRDVAVDSSKAGELLATTSEPSGVPTTSARELLELRGEDADALRALAEWHMAVHPDDFAERSAKKLAERALALAVDDVDTLYLVARANRSAPGESAAEIRHNERVMPLKRVVELEQGHAGAWLDLADFWSELNPLPYSAEQAARKALAAAPQSPRALMALSRAHGELGRDAMARAYAEQARASGAGKMNSQLIVAEADALLAKGDRRAAVALLESTFTNGRCDRGVVSMLCRLHLEGEDLPRLLAVHEGWLSRAPFDVGRMLETAEVLERAGDLARAREQVERARHVCPEDSRVFRLLARLAEREGDLDAACAALDEVVRLDPGYDIARRQRAVLAASAEQPERFEDPWRWDSVERAGTLARSGEANDPVQVVDRTTVWKVEPDGTERQYEHMLLQVENAAGVKALDAYWISYPSDASLQVYNVRIVHADGTFERAPAPRGGDQPWNGMLVRGFDLPPLVPGDMVDVEYRIDPTKPDVFGQYFGERHAFQVDFPDALAPVARAELVVIAPEALQLHVKEHNGAGLEITRETKDGEVIRTWVARDLARPAMEGLMPARSELVPLVDISTFASWQAFASWWWTFIEKEFVTTQAMKDKVSELVAGLSSEADKVRAIARFVGQEIRYNAWSFGTHGYEPFSAATIFERRFGDCKDKSILLRQLLAEIGVEAHPVLINAEYRKPDEKLDIAMVGHFNHCIAYLPATADRPGYYLDATADRNPVEYLRADDQGAKVLHVRDGNGEIVQIPYAEPEDNAFVRNYEITLARDGSGEVRLEDHSIGMFGVQNRYRFGGEQGDLRERLARALADAFGKVGVLDASTSKLEDIGAPAGFETRFEATGLWTRDSTGAQLRTGFDEVPILGVAAEAADERQHDLVLDRPFELRSKLLYRLPEGARPKELPVDADVHAAGLLDYSLRVRTTPEGIEVERVFTLRGRRIPRARYSDFRAALEEVRSAEARTVVLKDLTPAEANPKEGK
ncbi:MAG: DUF3857 domain-containing protein [Planctomycetes bacterium]|nr:DUF3857 domain-containing protein [Planctomycetota bacterium]